jgi:hypothetical protein
LRARARAGARALARVAQSDDATIAREFERLTRSHRILAPFAFAWTAFSMLLDGLRLLIANRRLLFVMVVPAVWIWLAMYDLKAHVLYGRSFREIKGAIVVPIALGIVLITVACFLLNAVFAFTIDGPRPPFLRGAFERARAHLKPILLAGAVVGVPLAIATTVAPRWGHPWFAVILGTAVGVMMIAYVSVPARIVGARSDASRRDRLTASALSTAIGATVTAPPYIMARVGLLMLGSPVLFIPGILLFAVGFVLQAGATGAVRAIKLNAALRPAAQPAQET